MRAVGRRTTAPDREAAGSRASVAAAAAAGLAYKEDRARDAACRIDSALARMGSTCAEGGVDTVWRGTGRHAAAAARLPGLNGP
jgi:hypothetical protein